jgi:hypothetical protein
LFSRTRWKLAGQEVADLQEKLDAFKSEKRPALEELGVFSDD